MSSSTASEKAALVSRLLGNDSALGIIAGLTTLARATQADNNNRHDDDDDDDDEDDDDDGDVVANARRLGLPGMKSSPNGKAKPTTPASEMNVVDKSLSSVAKKYSVHEQRDAIRKLQQQNQILKQELSIEFRDAKQLLAQEKRQRVEYLQHTTELFRRKVDTARKTLAKLDEQIASKQYELETLRQQQFQNSTGSSSNSGPDTTGSTSTLAGQASSESSSGAGGGAMGETSAAITRRVRSLENRLELALVKRNEMDSINKHFKAQIEKVRKDRVIFDGIYKKLEKELSDFQSRHDASVEELRRASETKELVGREIQQIQASAENEQRLYELQFKELRAAIESAMRDVHHANTRLEESGALALGVFTGSETDETTASSPLRGKTSGGGSTSANGAPHSSAAPSSSATNGATDSPLKRLTALSSWKIGFDRALASTSDSIVGKYDQVFDGIKKMTGISDITKIAAAITQKDEENFKRFKHVESLHREEASLRAQLEQLTHAIDEFKLKEGIATGATQKQQYRHLEATYQTMLEKNKAFDVAFEDTTNKLTRVKSSIHSIHSMLAHANCAKSADQFSMHSGSASLALGAHSARDVTDTNVLEYLQAIEIFTSSLMKENHDASVAAADSNSNSNAGPSLSSGSRELYPHVAALSMASAAATSTSSSSSSAAGSVSSPIGHGPSTLPSDPTQKLRVRVPSFGGLNGVIILPANSATSATMDGDGRTSVMPKQHLQQQQQRKKTARFELTSRKSLSQQQFAAALSGVTAPSSAASSSSIGSFDDGHRVHTPTSTAPGSAQSSLPSTAGTMSSRHHAPSIEEDEEERAFTYEELRAFAAKHLIKKRDDPTRVASPLASSAKHARG